MKYLLFILGRYAITLLEKYESFKHPKEIKVAREYMLRAQQFFDEEKKKFNDEETFPLPGYKLGAGYLTTKSKKDFLKHRAKFAR